LTVCIAALCDGATKVVIASDRMLTGSDVEFEQDIRKFESITNECVALSAGSALEKVNLIRSCRAEVSMAKNLAISDIVSSIKNCFVSLRVQNAEELHLKPLGLTLSDFLRVQGQLSPDLVLRQTYSIENARLEVVLLIVGVDSGGAHIYLVTDPGVSRCYDAVGFCAIGSGEHHAELAFIRSNFSESFSLRKALFLAYRGKRDAETAPGVGGQFTDLAYIDEHGLHVVAEENVQKLATAYQALQKDRSSVDDEINRLIESLSLNDQGG
jgi:20S proteasome alpha/beta subunit